MFVNERSLSASVLEISPFSYNSEVILAPVGYPEESPMDSAKAPLPRNTKKRFHDWRQYFTNGSDKRSMF